MKVKTSITLEAELLSRIDEALFERESRSAFFMDAARQLAQKRERAKRDARDSSLLSTHADVLNKEALDNLAFVGDIFQERGEDRP